VWRVRAAVPKLRHARLPTATFIEGGSMSQAIRLIPMTAVVLTVASTITGCKLLSSPEIQFPSNTLAAAQPHERDGLRARFFGTTTILVADDNRSVMIDGFFSRPNALRVVLGGIEPDENRINAALVAGRVGEVDVLLVAHSHHDHAMDSPVVAKKTGALLVGSQSTAHIARGAGFPEERFCVIAPKPIVPPARPDLQGAKTGREDAAVCPKLGSGRFRVGQFWIDIFQSKHAVPTLSFLEVTGHITEDLHTPAGLRDYKSEGTYTFLLHHPKGNILIVPSASNDLELGDAKANVVFLGIGYLNKQGAAFTRKFWDKVVTNTGAKLVIPVHWDWLTKPVRGNEPLIPLPYIIDDVGETMKVLRECAEAQGVELGFMPMYEPVLVVPRKPRDPKLPTSCQGLS
jgi:L-ascorbate metabolism protein UlaG (beta-lactamase superfamily)